MRFTRFVDWDSLKSAESTSDISFLLTNLTKRVHCLDSCSSWTGITENAERRIGFDVLFVGSILHRIFNDRIRYWILVLQFAGMALKSKT